MLTYRDMTFCPFWGDCQKGGDCERALTQDIENAAIKAKLPLCRESVIPDCFVAGETTEPEPATATRAEEWDKTTEDCRNCAEFFECWAIDPEKAREMIEGDDEYEDDWTTCSDDDCFEPIDDD